MQIEEEIEDGVYTNYTYGFSFEYPEEIFIAYDQREDNSILWANQDYSQDVRNVDLAEQIFVKLEFVNSEKAKSRIQDVTSDNFPSAYSITNIMSSENSFSYSFETTPNAETSYVKGRESYIKIDGKYAVLSVFSPSKDSIHDIFSNVVDSFKFISQ